MIISQFIAFSQTGYWTELKPENPPPPRQPTSVTDVRMTDRKRPRQNGPVVRRVVCVDKGVVLLGIFGMILLGYGKYPASTT